LWCDAEAVIGERKTVGDALRETGLSTPLLQMARIGEQAGRLDIILEKAAQCYERGLEMETG